MARGRDETTMAAFSLVMYVIKVVYSINDDDVTGKTVWNRHQVVSNPQQCNTLCHMVASRKRCENFKRGHPTTKRKGKISAREKRFTGSYSLENNIITKIWSRNRINANPVDFGEKWHSPYPGVLIKPSAGRLGWMLEMLPNWGGDYKFYDG